MLNLLHNLIHSRRRLASLRASVPLPPNPRHLELQEIRAVLRSERPATPRNLFSELLRSGSLHLGNLRLDNLRLGTSPYQPSDSLQLHPHLHLVGQRRRLHPLRLVLLLSSRNNRSLHLGSRHNHNQPLGSRPGLVPLLTLVLRQHRGAEERFLLSLVREHLRLGLVHQPRRGQSLVSQHSAGETMRRLWVRQQLRRLRSASLYRHQLSGPRLHNLHSVSLGLPCRQPSAKLLILPPHSRLHQHNQRLANHRSLRLLSDSRPLGHHQHNLSQDLVPSNLSPLQILLALPLLPRNSLLDVRISRRPWLLQELSLGKTDMTSCSLRTTWTCFLVQQRRRSKVRNSSGGKYRNGYHRYSYAELHALISFHCTTYSEDSTTCIDQLHLYEIPCTLSSMSNSYNYYILGLISVKCIGVCF